MKKFGIGMLILAVAAMVSSAVIAQPPGGGDRPRAEGERDRGDGPPPRREGGDREGGSREGERRGDFDGPPPRREGEGGRGAGGERGFSPPPNPLMMALDADGDHMISADEIKNAAKALASLDKNKDGKLSQDELRPERGPGGFDGPPTRREGEGGRPGEGRPDESGRGPGGNPSEFLDRIMSFDEDKDGKLSRKEIPERMQRMLDRGDANKDGALDREELKKMFEQMQGGQGGRPPQDGNRPARDGDRPPRDGDQPRREGNPEGNDRPRRPATEE